MIKSLGKAIFTVVAFLFSGDQGPGDIGKEFSKAGPVSESICNDAVVLILGFAPLKEICRFLQVSKTANIVGKYYLICLDSDHRTIRIEPRMIETMLHDVREKGLGKSAQCRALDCLTKNTRRTVCFEFDANDFEKFPEFFKEMENKSFEPSGPVCTLVENFEKKPLRLVFNGGFLFFPKRNIKVESVIINGCHMSSFCGPVVHDKNALLNENLVELDTNCLTLQSTEYDFRFLSKCEKIEKIRLDLYRATPLLGNSFVRVIWTLPNLSILTLSAQGRIHKPDIVFTLTLHQENNFLPEDDVIMKKSPCTLKKLTVEWPTVTCDGVKKLGYLKNLQELTIGNSPIYDNEVPYFIFIFPALQILHFKDTINVTKEGLKKIAYPKNIKQVKLNDEVIFEEGK